MEYGLLLTSAKTTVCLYTFCGKISALELQNIEFIFYTNVYLWWRKTDPLTFYHTLVK